MIPFYEHKTVLLQSRRECDCFSFPLHLHDRPEFMYINKGSLTLNLIGKKIILNEGDLALVFPYTIHGYECAQGCYTDYSLVICRTEDCGEFRDILTKKHPTTPLITAANLHSDIVRIMNEFITIDINRSNASLIRALIQLTLARAVPCLELNQNTSDSDLDVTVQAVRYVTEHYTQPLTLEWVASNLNISRFRLSRLFNEQVGAGFSEYINYLRIEQAKNLLISTDYSIIEIALDCGYGNLRTFNRVFKESAGISPLQFRKREK